MGGGGYDDDMTAENLWALDGQSVLVKPSRPENKNSVGMRGSLRVVASAGPAALRPQVELVVQWPDTCEQEAQTRSVTLNDEELAQLLEPALTGAGAVVCDRVLASPGVTPAAQRK